MFRFFVGLTVAQVATALLVALYPGAMTIDKLLPLTFLILLLSTVISLWFSTISRQLGDRRVATLKQQFAAEREKLNVNAERTKTRLVKKNQKELEIQARRAKTTANIKVGTAVAVAAGFGLFMMFTQFITLGLLTLTTAGGAVGGYLARARRADLLQRPEYKLIEADELDTPSVENLPTDEPVLSITDAEIVANHEDPGSSKKTDKNQ